MPKSSQPCSRDPTYSLDEPFYSNKRAVWVLKYSKTWSLTGVGTDLLERLSSSLFTVCFESSLKPLSYAGRGGYSIMTYKGRLLLKWVTFSDYRCGQYLFQQCLILPKYHLLTPFQWLKNGMQSLGDVKGVPYFFVEGIWKRYLSRGKLYIGKGVWPEGGSSPYETLLTTPFYPPPNTPPEQLCLVYWTLILKNNNNLKQFNEGLLFEQMPLF